MASGFTYYSRTIVAGCIATASMVAVAYIGSVKPLGIPFLLIYSMITAVFSSFLVALLVRRTIPHLNPLKLWIWLIVGSGVELLLVLAAGYAGRYFTYMAGESSTWMQYMRLLFSAPLVLFPKWWLSVPIGMAIGAVGYSVEIRQSNPTEGHARPLSM